MTHVIQGDMDKMGILYEKYKRPLFAYFFKLSAGDIQTSEDLVHAVFYRVIRYKTSFKGQGSFAKWLFRIAHNVGIDYHRKNRYYDNYKSEIQATQTLLYENNDLEKAEEQVILKDAMQKLKTEEREMLILAKVDCLKYKEVAEIFNTTESNVKIRVFRALKRLKDIYSELERTKYEKTVS